MLTGWRQNPQTTQAAWQAIDALHAIQSKGKQIGKSTILLLHMLSPPMIVFGDPALVWCLHWFELNARNTLCTCHHIICGNYCHLHYTGSIFWMSRLDISLLLDRSLFLAYSCAVPNSILSIMFGLAINLETVHVVTSYVSACTV
jgi:hypothetical protein